jgi:plasmid stability protein
MPQILVRNVGKSTVEALKLRARRHRTSLQAEVKGILEEASSPVLADAASAAKRIQERLRRSGAAFTDSGRSQAEDRRR